MAALVLLAPLLAASPASAASQNELVVGIEFDGQSLTGDDPLDTTLSGPADAHTPGLDERDDNGVVRTYDLVGYRADYTINEEGQTGATITLQLPPNMIWVTPSSTVDSTFPEGMFAGCLPGSTITSSATVYGFPAPIDISITGTNDILTCVVGDDDDEGSNGTIYPVAQLLADLDDQTKTLTGTLDTTEQTCAGDLTCSGSVDVISSGAPQANFKKGLDIEDADGNVVGREPNEFYPLERGGVPGWISVYHVDFRTAAGGILGSAPIDDTYPIQFFDHFWDSTSGTVLATSDGTLAGTSLLPGRAACGVYDGGEDVPAAGTWTCTQVSPTSMQFDLTGYDTDAFVANMDGSPNTSVFAGAQIAFWSPESELLGKDPMRNSNTISQSLTPPAGINTAAPILFGASSGPVPETTVLDNDAQNQYSLVTTTPGSRTMNSWVRIQNGPLQLREFFEPEVGATVLGVDDRDSPAGIGGYQELNQCATGPSRHGWCGHQQTPRGKTLTVTAGVSASSETPFVEPLHLCLAIDTTHASVTALPSAIDVMQVEGAANDGSPDPGRSGLLRPNLAPTIGGYSIAPNEGPLAHVIGGDIGPNNDNNGFRGFAAVPSIDPSRIVVEFGSAVTPIVQTDSATAVVTPISVDQHGLTCNNGDAVEWVDSTGDLSGFDVDSDGLYEGINLVRVRMIDGDDWLRLADGTSGSSLELDLQIEVHADPVVDAAGQEIFVFSSRSSGDWDPAVSAAPAPENCRSNESSWGGNTATTTGWCNLPYLDDNELSPYPGGGALFHDTRSIELTYGNGTPRLSHADKVHIVEANIAITKTNLDGLADIADNGDSVIFGIDVSTVGASTDTLQDVTLVDRLPAGYTFVGFTQLPSTPGASCTEGDTFTCTFGDHPGGWSDYVEVEVRVQNTEANRKITNTATLTADRDGVALTRSSSAFSRTSQPFDEAAIVKAVSTIEGPCVAHPTLDPPPDSWADRCEMTDFTTGQLLFDLTLSNEGNVEQTDVRFVDVLPHLADEAEAASATSIIGDGRSPESDFEGDVAFVSYTGDVQSVWVTGDDATTVSRDPDNAITDTTWCDAVNGTVQNPASAGSGSCPTSDAAITAIYAVMDDVPVGGSITGTLELVNAGHECDDIWTNTFGARHERTILPIRSNDVSIMVHCEYDLALEEILDPAFAPAADWLTPGTSTVDFLIEVTNQGDPVEDFDVTDYVDTDVFTFDTDDNPAGTTGGSNALAFTWDATNPAAPVVSIDGALGTGESVTIPVTLIIEDETGTLENWSEISYFDSDGDPSNGDSDPANSSNPSTGPLLDEDSTPNADQADDAQPDGAGDPGDGVIGGDGSGSDPIDGDEDDHDVAGVPLYDLELVDVLRDPGLDLTVDPWQAIFDVTITNQGTDPVWAVVMTHYPAAGLTYNAAATADLWAGEGLVGLSDAAPTFTIDGPIEPGASITVPRVFDVTDLSEAPYVDAAEISGFDIDSDPVNAPSALAIDVDSTPDAVDDDDRIDHIVAGYDPDGDGNLNEATPGDEDDHDIAEVGIPFDLALRNTVDPTDPDLLDGITAGDDITFFLEVFNQAAPVEDLDVTDYVSSSWTFDPAKNPPGVTTGDQPLPYSWDGSDPLLPVASVDGSLGTLESVVIPIVLTVDISGGGDSLINVAEISYFDSDGDPSTGDSDPANPANPLGEPLADIDSTPDTDNTDPTSDNVIDENAISGDISGDGIVDEDDHDPASIKWWDLELLIERSATQPYVIDLAAPPLVASFDITVNNQGLEDAVNITVLDTPAAGLTFSSLVDGTGTVTSTGPDEFTIAALDAGDSVTFTATYAIDLATLETPTINTAEISGLEGVVDPDGAVGPLPEATYPVTDVDSTPDIDPTNDLVSLVGTVDPADSHNTLDNDPDADGNLHNAVAASVEGADEDDHDTEAISVPFDLALTNVFESMDTPLLPDGSVTMLLTVTNQAAAVKQIDLVDYVDPAIWASFDPALNPDGAMHVSSTAAAPFSFVWDASDPANPIAVISADSPTDMFALGETIAIPITLTLAEDFDPAATEIVNIAEIARFDNNLDSADGDSSTPNPAGTGPLADADSTPDTEDETTPGETIGSDLVDNSIDGDGTAGSDEDDHDPVFIPVYDLELILEPSAEPFDFAPSPATASFDITVTNQGTEDAYAIAVTEHPPAGLTFDPVATADAWADAGIVSVTNGSPIFAIDSILAGESITFPVVYAMDLAQSPFEIAAEISAFDDDADPANVVPALVVDLDSTPSDTNSDAVIDHDVQNYDPDGDDNVNEATPGDDDDHDIEVVAPYDLALIKTLASVDSPLLPDGTVTMLLTVTNQAAPIASIKLTDYLDPDMWQAFDPSLNPDDSVDASSTAASALSFMWDDSDPLNPMVMITPDTAGETIGFGETVVVPITARPVADLDTSAQLVGIAEISNFDDDLDPANGDAASGALTDLDSVPDSIDESTAGETIGGDLVDDAIDGDGTPGNDEDDHDPVVIPLLDLALRQVVSPTTEFPITPGGMVTFDIELINQGNVDVTDPSLVDYVDPAMWKALDPANNPEGVTTGDAALPFTWAQSANGQDGDLSIDGTLAAGESVTVSVTLMIADGADLEALANIAEVTGGTATVDDDGDITTPPVEVTNPDGTTVLDVDSTPDSVNDDPLVDDVVDGSSGDEDDHDIALVVPPTYRLGNQVWNDANDNGVLDAGEAPIAGVVIHLFADANGDGQPDDSNGDGSIDVADSLATATTDAEGSYLFTDLPAADYVVGVAPENWDGVLAGHVSSGPTAADTDGDVDEDDDGTACGCPDGYVFSGGLTLDDAEPVGESGLDNDPNHPDALSNLSVDFGFWAPVFDLALRKSLGADQAATGVTVGSDVTFTITVFNQGDVAAANINLVDYLSADMELNDPQWALGADDSARAVIPGPIEAGQSMSIDITVKVTEEGDVASPAEIVSASAIGPDGVAFLLPTGEALPDIDSVMDDSDGDQLTDDRIDGTTASGDEDDHDVAGITVLAQPGTLAFTGSSSRQLASLALLLILLGGSLAISAHRWRFAIRPVARPSHRDER